ncbi:MAG: aminopeptidase P family protein [Firmicutes bacterium]|nr:aminopeptidase P family protein [Bacillota bacterium]
MMRRLANLREQLADLSLEGMLITNWENRRYLSGFTGTAGALVIGVKEAFLITDFRYWEQAALESPDFELYKGGPRLWESVKELLAGLKWKRVGFEAGALTYKDYRSLEELVAALAELVPVTDLVEQLRQTKDAQEIELIKKAAAITDLAWEKTIGMIKPGVQERELALEFDYQLRLNGAEGSAFPTIVASGKRAALPHAAPSAKVIEPGELVLIDGGAVYQGYHADMTRTVLLGKADPEQRRIYDLVLKAQVEALNNLRAGLTGREADEFARKVIAAGGYADYFGHGLGHSVGLNIHENPRLSPTESNQIPKGAVVTVEPGIYLPDWGGIRIEDLVVVEEHGIRNLTGSPKEKLLEI